MSVTNLIEELKMLTETDMMDDCLVCIYDPCLKDPINKAIHEFCSSSEMILIPMNFIRE